ncbi:MAG: phosphoribosylaminoimidazole-succinocarboxamide synthase [Candidatus Poribacteria bacterium]|nr:phosphoribosylaminoimidazole-succinocarboxamide synthase [Candidatus Poribacteria bacterium]
MSNILLETNILDIKPFSVGKVRDIYELDDKLLFIATDRISAFDVVLPTGIPYKGEVLNSLSIFWFNLTKHIIDNHLITADVNEYPETLQPYKKMLAGRSMIVKKAKRINLECVVRAYLSGSAWKAYKEKGEICGIKLPSGLKESDKLPKPIFTPTNKADSGHDMELTHSEAEKLVGKNIFEEVKEKSLQILVTAGKEAESKGIIIADTKFEFGIYDGKVILIDEVLTPDSSRFWHKDDYEPGRSQKSYDKQYVRDYLEVIKWDKNPPAPELPDEIVKKTTEKYIEAYKRLTGKALVY